ncbi:AraC family transcriptional regulator [Xylophilus sp. GOD-11R]|uniref:helix-turn-helix transcriptional regulator n=1 Tax=Xylophilus sp. GOD-11R TaxID=3089814 RepID=UPI00298C7369|nr:AraC family transcriptional regulator [Xylophilus sp. GOD-11R]WPB54919.1 AraC family transcriptional regulator [Xylophilus sp. GOD-11R]
MPTSQLPLRTWRMHERAEHLDFDIRFQGARNELTQPHRHGYFQIQIGLEGDTQQAIGAAVRPFGRCYLSFVLPHRIHVIPHPPGSRYCIVNFSQDFLWPEIDADTLDLDAVAFSAHPQLGPFLFQEYLDFVLDEPDFSRLSGWLDELQRFNAERSFGGMAIVRGLLLQIIGLACLRQERELQRLALRHEGRTSRHDALQRVVRYVRDNLEREMSLTDAAAAAFLSPNYLANLLKKETGQTFTELVTERRLDRAKELLTGSSMQVREVARRCGYGDEAYFNRRFRQVVGCTPRAFRDQQVARLRG